MMVCFSRTTTVTIRETLMFGKQFRTLQNNRRFLIFMLLDRRKLTVVACVCFILSGFDARDQEEVLQLFGRSYEVFYHSSEG